MAKYKIRNLKFLKQTFKVSIKTFCKKWEKKLFPNDYQLEKCQNEYHLGSRDLMFSRHSWHVLMTHISLLKRNL